MKLIAHRGNINGINPKDENHPDYLKKALDNGYDIETDVWIIEGIYYLGHDKPQYKTDLSFLEDTRIWCHCKNLDALLVLKNNPKINCFWHENDCFTLTTKGYIWTYPGKELTSQSICVMPEWNNFSDFKEKTLNIYGICSDFVGLKMFKEPDKYSKSIVIIGKGPSISRCTKEYIDSFDEVAICGHPIYTDYEHLISNRAKYDFLNCGDPNPYPAEFVKKLGITHVYNTAGREILPFRKDTVPFEYIKYHSDVRGELLPYFKEKYDLDPATGTMAFEMILRMKKHYKIALVGFDLMEIDEKNYYYDRKHVQYSLQKYYIDKALNNNGKVYNVDGNRLVKSGHDTEKTYKYMLECFSNNFDIIFEIISNREFPNLNNLKIV